MRNKANIVKILGVVAMVAGFTANLVTEWVNEQKMEEMIDEKLNEALAAKDEEES